jgi:hypothetical protein
VAKEFADMTEAKAIRRVVFEKACQATTSYGPTSHLSVKFEFARQL